MQTTSKRRGSALLTVLWLTAALSAIGLALANNVRSETERAATNVDDAKAWFAARGAVERTLLRMNWGQSFYQPGMRSMELDFPASTAHVDIIPESSKLNLNAARPDELVALMTALGSPPERAMEIAAAIVDWRTADVLHASPFDAFYQSQSPSFLPPHTSFKENEELLMVRGVTNELYYGAALGISAPDRPGSAGLRDCISVFGGLRMLDINSARAETMQAVGATKSDAETIVRMRSEQTFTYQNIQPAQEALGPVAGRLGLVSGTLFTIRASSRLKTADGHVSDLRRTVAALVKLPRTGYGQPLTGGVQIIRWFDRG